MFDGYTFTYRERMGSYTMEYTIILYRYIPCNVHDNRGRTAKAATAGLNR